MKESNKTKLEEVKNVKSWLFTKNIWEILSSYTIKRRHFEI